MSARARWLASRGLKHSARWLALIGVVLLVLGVRVIESSRAELGRGDAHRQLGDNDRAVTHYRRAVSWYAPGNAFGAAALSNLVALAEEAEAAEDTEEALRIWRSVRGSIQSTRSFYTPYAETQRRADIRIVALSAEIAGDAPRAGMDTAALRRALEASERPAIHWVLLLLAGWLSWVGAAFAFSIRAFDEEGQLLVTPARRWGTAVVIGFGLFVLGMALA